MTIFSFVFECAAAFDNIGKILLLLLCSKYTPSRFKVHLLASVFRIHCPIRLSCLAAPGSKRVGGVSFDRDFLPHTAPYNIASLRW